MARIRKLWRCSKPLILSRPLRSISRSSRLNFYATMAGIPTVCEATGRSWNKRRGRARKMELATWKLSTFQNTGPHGYRRRCVGSAPQGHSDRLPYLLRGHIRKIWEVDPLSCSRCQTEMKIVSFITQPDVIKKILVHLELWEEFTKRRPPPMPLAAEKVEIRGAALFF
jgi:hypothetical protein